MRNSLTEVGLTSSRISTRCRMPSDFTNSYLERIDSNIHQVLELLGVPLACVWVGKVDISHTGLPQVPSERKPSGQSISAKVFVQGSSLPDISIGALDKVALLDAFFEEVGALSYESSKSARAGIWEAFNMAYRCKG